MVNQKSLTIKIWISRVDNLPWKSPITPVNSEKWREEEKSERKKS